MTISLDQLGNDLQGMTHGAAAVVAAETGQVDERGILVCRNDNFFCVYVNRDQGIFGHKITPNKF